MRLSLLSFATSLGLLTDVLVVEGFSVQSSSSSSVGRASLWRLCADASGDSSEITRTKPLSPKEIKAQMREKQGLSDEDEEPPKLFSDSLYDDMKNTLLALEKRIKEGPGSLSMLEVEEVCAQTQRIVVEMRDFEAGRVNDLGSAGVPAATSAATPEPASEVFTHTEEGPAYEGEGGLGLAKGTVNTYVIPGMDEMSSEEYRDALQQSIIDRQTVRKSGGKYGNRATWDYLNNLTGETGVLKKQEDIEAP
jgi:hypothetical protein